MNQETSEVQKKIEALPLIVQNFLYSKEMAEIVQKIGTVHQLHIDQVGALEAEAAAIMIGITKPEEFVTGITEALGIDEGKSNLIAKDVNEQLFLKVRKMMKDTPSNPPPTTPAPSLSSIASPHGNNIVVKKLPEKQPLSASVATNPTAFTPALAPVPDPIAPSVAVPAVAPKAIDAPIDAPVEAMLAQKTVSTAPTPPQAAPGTPQEKPIYKADPYREPVE